MTNYVGNNSGGISIVYEETEVKLAIKNNEKIEDKLHMIICISNPCNYKKRYKLAKEFIRKMNIFDNVLLYIVELCYNDQKFQVTKKGNPRHLQLRTNSAPIWAKENLWNLGVKLLPKDWKAVAFCDADVSFENVHFADDTLKILNGFKDVVHLHSHCIDLDSDNKPMRIFNSFGYQYANKQEYSLENVHFFHPGFSAAFTRKAYEKMGGIIQIGILGSGDHHMFLSFIGQADHSLCANASFGYTKAVLEYQDRCHGLRLGYTPGTIKHYWHGTKKNRQYNTRWEILIKHQFDPYTHLAYEPNGIMTASSKAPKGLTEDIMKYFSSRNEDE